MKKILVTCFSVIIAVSFAAVVLAANPVTPSSVTITKQLILSDDEPAPLPDPAPAPEPEPATRPDPEPEPN